MDARQSSINAVIGVTRERLEAQLAELGRVTDVAAAKTIAKQFLLSCAMDRHTPDKLRQLEGMTSIYKIYSLCFNTMLSGEGLKVQK